MRGFIILATAAEGKTFNDYCIIAVCLFVFLLLALSLTVALVGKNRKKKREALLRAEMAERAECEACEAASQAQLAAAITAAVAAYLAAETEEKKSAPPSFRVVAFRRASGAQPWIRP